jgi:hypothetical protein
VKEITPFPDQDTIRHEVAKVRFCSKLDMSEVYEQIHVHPDHVLKTAFSTIYGTYLSAVMQQGDCNAQSTFQRLMMLVFPEYIGRFVYVYLDDIFIFSDSIKKHEEHLAKVFCKLCEVHFYLSPKKVDLYSPRMDCHGHIIDNKGIHADADKMLRIHKWRQPHNYNNVQCFLGLVQYLAHYMPDVCAYTTPLLGCVRNNHPFVWTPLLDRCLQSIKMHACKGPILKPIDPCNPDTIWVICNSFTSGVGAVYGQGPDWQTSRIAGFLSKKFLAAQQCYRTHEHETIAILEALMKWEDKLIGHKVTIVTNHKGFEYFKTQPHLSDRQVWWWEYLSRYDYDLIHVDGVDNKVADCLSHYYENKGPDDNHLDHEFVTADACLDPEGKLQPID